MRPPAGAALTLSLAGLLLLVACGDETTRPEQEGPTLAISSTGALVCDITGLKSAARAYTKSNNDQIFTVISDLQKAYRDFGLGTATTKLAFDGLARLAAIRFSADQKSGSTGAEGNLVARGFLGCTNSTLIGTLPADVSFTASLNAGGLFEVRGDDTVDPPTDGVYSKGATPVWAAQPSPGATWGSSSGNVRHLIYGYPTTLASQDEVVTAQAFEFSTAPAGIVYSPGIVRGVCDIFGTTYRVQRHQSLLPFAPLTCPSFASLGELRNAPPTMVALAERVVDFFAPKPVQATMLGVGMAGLGSEYSPHLLVDLKAINFTFVSQPLDGFVFQPIPGSGTSGVVEVLVTTAGGRPLPGVVVTLSVSGNQGINVDIDGETAITDDAGIATFPNLTLNKAGGYTLDANGSYDGIPGNTSLSNLFNIKNQ